MAKNRTPIELVTDLLAQMTARAAEAEQRANAAEKSASEWYERYRSKDKELQNANKQIDELVGDLKQAVEHIEKLEKQGAHT